jgi:hypothetical protein
MIPGGVRIFPLLGKSPDLKEKGMRDRKVGVFLVLVLGLIFNLTIQAQNTEFVYQGSIQNGGTAASGNHDFEFLLFDTLSGPTQLGPTLTRSPVLVSAGTFAVKLDFGAQFQGGPRFLEIHVRQAGIGSFIPLTPRHAVNSAPYSVKSLNADNATQLGGVAANQYVTTTSGNSSYIQNSTSPQPQAPGGFNISGNGFVSGHLRASGSVSTGLGSFFLTGVGAKLNIVGGADEDGANDPKAVAFEERFGGFRHWIRTRHPINGGIDFFLNDSLNQDGSSGPGVGSIHVMTLGSIFRSQPGPSWPRVGIGTSSPLATFDIRGGADGSGNNDPGAIAFGYRDGGFRHWIRTRHNSVLGNSNAIDFFVNNSASAGGSTGAGVGSTHVMTLDSGRVGIGTISPTFKLEIVDASNSGLRVQTNIAGGTVASFGGAGAFQIDAPGIVGGRLNVNENGNVGIGTSNPNTKLQVAGGSVYIANPNSLIITSPNGACWFITVNDAGALSTIPVACP